jgi:hypothetical protein
MTVQANTPFGALAPVLKALAIFFLAIDSIASARRVLDRFGDDDSGRSLLRHAGVFRVQKKVLLKDLLG